MTTQDYKGPDSQRESVTVQQTGSIEHQERIIENKGVEKRLVSYRVTQLIVLVFGVLESLIGLRVLLKLIGANPTNPFAHDVYALTGLFIKPFATLIANPASQSIVLEVTSLIAMLVYGLLGWVLVTLIRLALMPTRSRSVSVINKEQHL